jgi:aspartate aminotransferase
MIEIAEGVPELISLNSDMSLNTEALESSLKAGVKILLINSPNNPSGASLTLEDYKKLAVLLKSFPDVQVILDDIYAELYWGTENQPCPHLFDVAPELFSRTVVVNGASKAYSMTGWRIGWAIGGQDIIGGLSRLQSQTTGCPNSIAQEATCAGILEGDSEIKTSVLKLKKRAELGFDLLSNIPGLKVTKPTGAFYFWVDLSELLEKWSLSDADFCSKLLESKAVVVVPGAEFGQPGFMRMSFAVSEEVFSEGVKRLADFIKEQV